MSHVLNPVTRPTTAPEIPTRSQARAAARSLPWSITAEATLASAVGLLLVALANYASVRGETWRQVPFWLGLALVVAPVAWHLVSAQATRGERVRLLVVLGVGLYLAKVVRSPFAFTFPDEFVHLRNLNEILGTTHLFQANTILSATPLYPGLGIFTSAVADVSGWSSFAAGLLVIGVARLVILLGLFLLVEELSGSDRLAALAALIYTANSNYLYWTAQFSYESLALPLVVLLLWVLQRRANTEDGQNALGWTVAALLLIGAVVVTHHLTSYVMVGLLWAWTLCTRVCRVKPAHGIGVMALVATLGTLGWLFLIALPTSNYLSPVFRDALLGLLALLADPGSGRELFRSGGGDVSPLWDRVVALLAVGITLVVMPFGLAQIVRRYRAQPLALVLAGLALAYPLLLPLRLSRATWEISNRASEFVFIGLAFVLALGLVEIAAYWTERKPPVRHSEGGARNYAVLAAAVMVVLLFMGGVVAGWSPNARLAQPYRAQAGSTVIHPQGFTVANWARGALGKNARIGTDYVNARFLLAYGEQAPVSGSAQGLQAMLEANTFDRGVQEIIRTNRLDYILTDRRRSNQDPLVGYYFADERAESDPYVDRRRTEKFDTAPGVSRVYDSGDITRYRLATGGADAPNQ